MYQNEYLTKDVSQIPVNENDDECTCTKKQCAVGIASIVIGIGGFALALLL